MTQATFKTHTGEIVTGDKLLNACKAVANELRQSANAVREENAFASHVKKQDRELYIKTYWLDIADKLDNADINSFTTWQRVNQALTGECVAFLNK